MGLVATDSQHFYFVVLYTDDVKTHKLRDVFLLVTHIIHSMFSVNMQKFDYHFNAKTT